VSRPRGFNELVEENTSSQIRDIQMSTINPKLENNEFNHGN